MENNTSSLDQILESAATKAEKIEKVEKKNDNVLLEVEFTKPSSESDTLKIYLKSSKNFKMFARKDRKYFDLGGVKCFHTNLQQLQGVQSLFYANNVTWQDNGMPNLSLLMAENLQRGVTFNFDAVPTNEQIIHNWINVFKQCVKQIYLGYMKPHSVRCVINCQTIETENHY